MDIKTPEERSKNMAAIHSKNTKPEIYFRKQLFAQGYRYSITPESIPGHPDIYLRKYNTAIFIHGCFWHRHQGCNYAYMPKSRTEFWEQKFEKNINRDNVVRQELHEKGIKQLVVWECTVKRMMKSQEVCDEVINQTICFLQGTDMTMEI